MKKVFPWIFVIIFAIASLVFYFQKIDLKHQIYYLKSIPDVELYNYLVINDSGFVIGEAAGFVAFRDIDNQPKGLRQYVSIKALDTFDSYSRQLFSVEDIISIDPLPPTRCDPVLLFVEQKNDSSITLSDNDQNKFILDRNDLEVRLLDNTGDQSRLITNIDDYREFMRNFLR